MNDAERFSDLQFLSLFGKDLDDRSVAQRRHFDGRLVGLDFNDRLSAFASPPTWPTVGTSRKHVSAGLNRGDSQGFVNARV
jgi:hypothetical protein